MREYLVVALALVAGVALVATAMGARRLLAPADPTPAKLTTSTPSIFFNPSRCFRPNAPCPTTTIFI